MRSVHTLKKRGRIVTGQVGSGQKGQFRAVQGSSKIVAALTFPKLAQLCTGQLRAARAGFQKLFRPHELKTHLTLIHINSTLGNPPPTQRQFQFGRCAAHSRQHRHYHDNRRHTHTVIPAKAGIHRGEGMVQPFSSLLCGLRKAMVIPAHSLPSWKRGRESTGRGTKNGLCQMSPTKLKQVLRGYPRCAHSPPLLRFPCSRTAPADGERLIWECVMARLLPPAISAATDHHHLEPKGSSPNDRGRPFALPSEPR